MANGGKEKMGVPIFMEGSLISFENGDPRIPKLLGTGGPENGDPGSLFWGSHFCMTPVRGTVTCLYWTLCAAIWMPAFLMWPYYACTSHLAIFLDYVVTIFSCLVCGSLENKKKEGMTIGQFLNMLILTCTIIVVHVKLMFLVLIDR